MKLEQRFPHISRLFFAKSVERLRHITSALLFISLIAFLYAINLAHSPIQKENLDQTSRTILFSPFSPASHFQRAQYYKNIHNSSFQLREQLLTKDLLSTKNSSSVLGESTQISIALDGWETEPKKLQSSLSYWERVISTHPDYRDAYIQAAYLANRLGNSTLSNNYNDMAATIDPRFSQRR